MAALTHCSCRSHTRAGRRCTDFFSGAASPVCRTSGEASPSEDVSIPVRSAYSKWISQECRRQLYLFVGIYRTSKLAVIQLVDKAIRRTAWEFLEHLLEAVPYRIHTILTDNGIQFADQPRNRNTAWSRQMRFDMICD